MVEKSIKFRFIDLYVGSSSELEKAQMECIQSLHDSSAKLEQRERISWIQLRPISSTPDLPQAPVAYKLLVVRVPD